MPFARFGFQLYRVQDATALLENAGFIVEDVQQIAEASRDETGAVIDKLLNIIMATTASAKPTTNGAAAGASRCKAD